MSILDLLWGGRECQSWVNHDQTVAGGRRFSSVAHEILRRLVAERRSAPAGEPKI